MIHRILIALLFAGAAARAESAFGSHGQIVPFGGIGYSHTGGGADFNQIGFAPGAMYFPTNNVAIGGQLIYIFDDFAGNAVHSLGFEPLVGFGVPLADKVAFFPRVGMRFVWAFQSGGTGNQVSIDGFAPLLFIPAPHLYIGFGPQLFVDVANSGAKQTSFGLGSEIGGYF